MSWLNHSTAIGWGKGALALAVVAPFVAFSCSDDAADGASSTTGNQTTGAAGGTGGSATGGIPGVGGMGAGGTGATGGEPPIVCTKSNYSNIPLEGAPAGECDLLQQDCPAGETCRPTPGGGGLFTTQCQNAPGLKALGASCINNNECQAGLFCAINRCSPVCCNNSVGDVPCEGGACNLSLSYSDDPAQYVWLCTYAAQCIPLTANACPEGEECHLEMMGVTSCFPPSGANAQEGEACQYLNDCGDMQHCQVNVCRYLCSLQPNAEPPGLGGCPVGQTCTMFGSGITDLGVCQPT